MTLDVGEALSIGTTNHRHHHDHYLDITLDVGEALSIGTTNHRHHHHDHHLDMTLDVGEAFNSGTTIEIHRIEMTALSQRTAPGGQSRRVPL